MTFSLVISHGRVASQWFPQSGTQITCLSESAGQMVRIIHIVDLECLLSFSPRSRECGYILLEGLEKVSDDDHTDEIRFGFT